MSSPRRGRSQRGSATPQSQRNSATPRRAARSSQIPASSPLFYQSSPAPGASGTAAANGAGPSSPIAAPSDVTDGDRTPRASRANIGDSSPIRYAPSSSPSRGGRPSRSQANEPRSDSSALFVRDITTDGAAPVRHRGEMNSDFWGRDGGGRRRMMVDQNGMPPSETNTFSNFNPHTSEADRMGGDGLGMLVWGTNISITDTKHAFDEFLRNYTRKYRMLRDNEIESVNGLPADHPGNTHEYMELAEMMLELNVTALNLDMRNLKAYPPTLKLWHQIQHYPGEIVPIMDDCIHELIYELAEKKAKNEKNEILNSRPNGANGRARGRDSSSMPPMPDSDAAETPMGEEPGVNDALKAVDAALKEIHSQTYVVRPFGLDKTINLRELNPQDMDKMVSVKGLVIRATPIIPDMNRAYFRCAVCNHSVLVDLDRGKITEPTVCPRELCRSSNSMQIIHNRCTFADKQVIKLQETPDSVPDGQTPHSVSLCVYDDLVDVCKAGDRIEVTGIFKCNQVRVNPRQRTVKNIFKTYVDVVHVQKVDKRRLGIDTSTIEEQLADQAAGQTREVRKVTEEEEAKIKEVASRPDVYELLSRSLAPSIYEMDDVKKGILLQLFGGTNKSFEKGGSPKYRGDINVLLCGDPSTAKSQILRYVHQIAPRGVYTSGKGSSAVGLTAYITRDPETRQLVLESGALVLSDGGVCCIDEFDKMADATRSVLHEVMEQQTVSIAKAGIITTLNARTSILASANPIGSKYNINLPVPQNIDLPPTLLSRFDLVYLVLDRIDEQTDRRMARHLVGMYLEDTPDNASANEILPVEFLTAYISYARANIQPKLTQAASTALVDAYVAMRALGADVRSQDRRITATTRQLESMIRLAEAHAKMRLSQTVEASDVEEAVRLIKSALKQAATDSRTGLIDMGLLTEGVSAGERRRKEDLKAAVLGGLDDMLRAGATGAVPVYNLMKKLTEEGSGGQVDQGEMMTALRALEAEGSVQLAGEGGRRTVRRVTGLAA
ncbi:minichromosome maintenance protein 4 (cell division control protein 54) [Venturia nashicola]|uniref:DNA helicase n=1 Tax=Venturia nashicola TaxID=86259 RepID=A0A4Z1PJT5_9PEZI|nr:minichromosome maintenance protein 4 (cell division control protein 54) [Venturia nashicola]